jgi:cationic amino acid transporter 1
VDDSVVDKENAPGSWVLNKKNRRKFAGWSIMFTCIGNFLLSYAASSFLLPGLLRYSLCGVGGLFLLVGLIVLICIDQDDARHSFGHSGGTYVLSFSQCFVVSISFGNKPKSSEL